MNEKYWAGGFLYNSVNNSVLLHQRDGNTKLSPNKWAFFGGLSEEEDNNPSECFSRELKEEIGLEVSIDKVVKLREYMNTVLNTYRVVFYVESDVSEKDLVLGEGAGFEWINLDRVNEYDVTDKTKDDLKYFLKQQKGQ